MNIMTKLRQTELLISLFLNSKQKFLLNFQKKNLIKIAKTKKGKLGNQQMYSKKLSAFSSSSSDLDEASHKIFLKNSFDSGFKS
jgi:hypothetical protein